MPGKYQPLADYFAALAPETAYVTLTLPEIEAIVGAPLPGSAVTAAFWTNSRSGPHAGVWLDVGWVLTERSVRTWPATITFTRLSRLLSARPRRR
jgi:hypothetical protein